MKKLLCLFLLGYVIHANAQLSTLRNFSNYDYNAGTQNWDVEQGFNDVMFFGNDRGLLAFDGNKWFLQTVPNYSVVRTVFCDREKARVYVGATDEFGYFNGNEARNGMEYHSMTSLLPANKKQFGEIWDILKWGKQLVFQSKNDLFVLQENGKMVCIHSAERINHSAVISGRLIVVTGAGVFTVKGNRMVRLPGTDVLMGKSVRDILPLADKILFVTYSDGPFLYDGAATVPAFTDLTPFFLSGQLYCASTYGNKIAFGTVRRGVVIKDLKTGYNTYVNIFTGMQNNTALSMAFDRTGNLWLGLDNGITCVVTEMPYTSLVDSKNSCGTGYASLVSGDKLYLGTNQGLFFVDYPLQSTYMPPTPQSVEGITGQVWSLKNIYDIVLCGNDNGAYTINGSRATRISGVDGTWNFIPLRRHPGFVLACDYQGFYILKRTTGGFEVQNRLSGLNVASTSFVEAKDGSVWISDWQRGVYHVWLDNELTAVAQQEFYNKGKVLAMSEQNQVCSIGGNVYISGVDGFYKYEEKAQKLVYDKTMSHLFNHYGSSLKVIETPGQGVLALAADYAALARHGKGGKLTLDSVTYKGMVKHLQLGLGTMGMLDNKRMVLNSINGFLIMKLNYENAHENSRVLVSSIRSSVQPDSILYMYTDNQGINAREVSLPHSLNSILIDCVMPEYRDEKAVTYQFFLDGYDKVWTQEQSVSSKEYTRLPKGTYTFRVKAKNLITGKTEEAALKIVIEPAWYETWFAYLIYILLTMALIWCGYQFARQQVKRTLRRQKEQQDKEMEEQRIRFEMEDAKKEKELAQLRTGQLEVELKRKVSELADYNINLTRKNDMLQALDEQMNELSESVRREDAKARITKKIKDIRHDIKMNMEEDGNWDKFEENFNLVYDNFMMKLNQSYPNLKLLDKKLCAYLRMGLSSKEMAQLLNCSERSIETARYRLRKKLGMDSGSNLVEFIKNFGEV